MSREVPMVCAPKGLENLAQGKPWAKLSKPLRGADLEMPKAIGRFILQRGRLALMGFQPWAKLFSPFWGIKTCQNHLNL
jgi:hypothetical protein